MNIGNLEIINSAANTATAITRAKLISLKPFLMTRFQQKQHEHERKCDQKKMILVSSEKLIPNVLHSIFKELFSCLEQSERDLVQFSPLCCSSSTIFSASYKLKKDHGI